MKLPDIQRTPSWDTPLSELKKRPFRVWGKEANDLTKIQVKEITKYQHHEKCHITLGKEKTKRSLS